MRIAELVLEQWNALRKDSATPWGITPTLAWVQQNYNKLLMSVQECLHPYEGCDENDASMRRYAVGPPAVPPESEDEEEDSDAEIDLDAIAALLIEQEQERCRKKGMTEEEIEARKKELEEEGGAKVAKLSKKEMAALNPSRKEKSGHRTAKTGQKRTKHEMTEEEKKKAIGHGKKK